MGRTDAVAHDPSAPAGHLPALARREEFLNQGTSTVWPVVLRLSRSMCACAASASG